MQTIITKSLRPTEARGQRVSVKCAAGRLVVGWDYAIGADENHRQAALELARKLGWDYVIVSGSDGERGYHNPIFDSMAAPCHRNSRIYRAAETQRVLDSTVDGGSFARLKLSADGGVKTKTLNVDRKIVGALLAIFNQNDID